MSGFIKPKNILYFFYQLVASILGQTQGLCEIAVFKIAWALLKTHFKWDFDSLYISEVNEWKEWERLSGLRASQPQGGHPKTGGQQGGHALREQHGKPTMTAGKSAEMSSVLLRAGLAVGL